MTDNSSDEPINTDKKWGKGKTDPDTWWKTGGPSPNPLGRPKGSKNQKTKFFEAINVKVPAKIGGKTSVSKGEISYHQLANKAASGDLKAIAMLMQLDAKFDEPDTTPPTAAETAADVHALEHYVNLRIKFTKNPIDPEASNA